MTKKGKQREREREIVKFFLTRIRSLLSTRETSIVIDGLNNAFNKPGKPFDRCINFLLQCKLRA